MATTAPDLQPMEEDVGKGLKPGALGLISSTIIATASAAPAYSLAATLGFVVVAVGLKSPLVAILAFVPMILTSIGYSELNKADPDCGTTFTWATRAFGPKTGWAGGWAIVAADVLVMASLAQVAGQYIFLLFNANGIGHNPASSWVLLTGILWIVFMTYICYRGIEVSANFQKALLSIEITMLRGVVGRRADPGRYRQPPVGVDSPELVLAEPGRPAVQRVRLRADPDGLHLLGLGHRPVGERGDQGPGEDARPVRHPVDPHPGRHLRHRDRRRPVLRGHRDHGHRPGEPEQLQRRALRARPRGLRFRHRRQCLLPGCC